MGWGGGGGGGRVLGVNFDPGANFYVMANKISNSIHKVAVPFV